jgi:hypothetical protein
MILNDEKGRIWKEAVMASLNQCPNICLSEQSETMQDIMMLASLLGVKFILSHMYKLGMLIV